MKAAIQVQAFFCDGDQHVRADCSPDLRLDRVFGGSKKRLDSQMLLDPLEKQLHLPALAVQVRDQLGFEREVVGQKRNALAVFVFGHHASQSGWVVFARIENCQHTGLVAHDIRVDSVHRMGVAAFEFRVGLGSCNKEGVGLVNRKQALEVQVSPIQQVVGTRLEIQQVQGVDLVRLAIGDVNERGYRAAQIQQRVQLYSRLVRAKRRPWIHGQAQVDGGGIEGIDRGIQVDSKRLLRIQRPRHCDQMLGEIGIDLPGPSSVCIGQRVSGNGLASQSHVIEPLGLSPKIDLDVAQGGRRQLPWPLGDNYLGRFEAGNDFLN